MTDDAPSHQPTRRQWVGFWSMIVQQTQNAFNDKMAQFILIPLGGAVGYSVESAAGLMIALPFVLFAPIAGWMSDRFSKRDVMLGAAVLQLLVLGWICGSVVHEEPAARALRVLRARRAVGVFQPGETRASTRNSSARSISASPPRSSK